MIRRFESFGSSGIFEDFGWDRSTSEFARINVIYGRNGSGKTSLANAIDGACSAVGDPSSLSLGLESGSSCRSTDRREDEIFKRIHVFGERYVERSHNFLGDAPGMDSVLTIGERAVGDEEKLSSLMAERGVLIDQVETCENSVSTAGGAYRKSLERVSERIVENLRSLGGQYKSRSHYSRSTVQTKLDGDRSDWQQLSPDDFSECKQTIGAAKQDEVLITTYGIRVRSELTDEAAKLLATGPVTIVLDTLAAHPEATSWVQGGLAHHENLGQCLFCGSLLAPERYANIQSHFSGEVASLEEEIQTILVELKELAKSTEKVLSELPARTAIYEDMRDGFDLSASVYKAALSVFEAEVAALGQRLQAKLGNVLEVPKDSRVGEFSSLDPSSLELLVAKHNDRVSTHDASLSAAGEEIEYHIFKEAEGECDELKGNISKARRTKLKTEDELRGVRQSIAALESDEGDPTPSAEVLNREVARLLGRSELQFEAVGSKYRVLRNGDPAVGLSSGEKTAITLVHFMEVASCHDPAGGQVIIVIDDPVSSLDSDILMGISTYIWSECVTKGHVAQLFLLTHNFELFRQWDIQLEGLHRKKGMKEKFPANMYELKTSHVVVNSLARRLPLVTDWPPSGLDRRKVRSSYQHAFIAVAQAKHDLDGDDSLEKRLDAQLLFPNVMRRMLETFLGFKRPEWVGSFTTAMRDSAQLLTDAGYEGDAHALRLRLARYMNVYSHDESPDTTSIINPDEVGPAILATFEFMMQLDPDHFKGLCKVAGYSVEDLLMPVMNR